MIPIFRAKKLDSDEYIIGDLFDGKYIIAKSELNRDISEALKHIREDILTKDCISAECKNEHHLLNNMLNKLLVNERLEHIYEIDPTTLSIHFPDMIDSQGNKIFASLQEDGKGGDVLNSGYGEVVIAIYEEGMIKFRYEESLPYSNDTINEIEDESFLSFYEVWQIRDKLESEVMGIQQ